jgi:hypothetical protein
MYVKDWEYNLDPVDLTSAAKCQPAASKLPPELGNLNIFVVLLVR